MGAIIPPSVNGTLAGSTDNLVLYGKSGQIKQSSSLSFNDTTGILSIGDTSSVYSNLTTDTSGRLNIAPSGSKTGFNTVTVPTAQVHLDAGTATANTAPLKLTSGTNLTTPESGAIEYDGTNLYFTDSGAIRRTIVGVAMTQTLTNKTLTAPVINVGSDATGDMYYRNAGVYTRLPIGTTSQSLQVVSGTPAWVTNPLQTTRIVTASGTVSVTSADQIVVVNKTVGAATTVNLPSAPTTGLSFVIKDGKGDASTNNITITPAAGTIDGLSTYVMTSNYQAIKLVYNGNEWNII